MRTAGPSVQPADDAHPEVDRPDREPAAALLLVAFVVIAVALTFRDLSHLRTFVAGDSGDSLLNLWILRSVQTGFPHGWRALWDAPIFHPAPDTLAYSESLLPVALLHWPLRLAFGDVLAFNVVYLGSWTLSSWCAYRLARRVTRQWGAAFVGALAYTYASVRLAHHVHFQLVVGGALVPLVVLTLLWCLDAPTLRRGVVLGASFAVLALTASYYGAMAGIVVVVVAGGWLLTRRGVSVRAHVHALGAAAGVVVVLVAPVAVEYVRLQRHPEFRRSFEPASAAHLGDFVSATSDDYLLRHVPVIASRSRPESRGVENRLFPGLVALGFGTAGAVVVAREARRGGWRRGRARELTLLALAGLITLVLAFGDRVTVAGHRLPLPFVALRHFVPGFAGIRATARLVIGAQVAVALLAAIGVDALVRTRRPVTRVVLPIALAGAVVAESAAGLTFVRVPTGRDDGGVAAALRARPAGVVLELPIASGADGPAWPFVEAPRQLEAVRDGRPRVNGYSGFQPKGFDADADRLDGFPAPDALAEARRRGVRYVVLRTRLVGELAPSVLRPVLDVDGVGRYSDASARRIVAALPPTVVVRVERLVGGYLVELR